MSKTETTRRSLLAIMGMAGTTALVNTEACAQDGIIPGSQAPALVQRGLQMQLRIADALEGLARGIRNGEIAATGLDTSSRLDVDTWLTHDVHITIEMLGTDAKTS